MCASATSISTGLLVQYTVTMLRRADGTFRLDLGRLALSQLSLESSTFEQVTNHVAGLPAYDGKPWTCSPAKAIDDVN